MAQARGTRLSACVTAFAILLLSGCTSLREYLLQRFKVGPNYRPSGGMHLAALDRRRRCPCSERIGSADAMVERLQRSALDRLNRIRGASRT